MWQYDLNKSVGAIFPTACIHFASVSYFGNSWSNWNFFFIIISVTMIWTNNLWCCYCTVIPRYTRGICSRTHCIYPNLLILKSCSQPHRTSIWKKLALLINGFYISWKLYFPSAFGWKTSHISECWSSNACCSRVNCNCFGVPQTVCI